VNRPLHTDTPHAAADRDRPSWVPALRIALIYAVVGGAWVLFSDILGEKLFGTRFMHQYHVQTFKGWAFIVVTAAMLYWLIRATFGAVHASEAARRASEARTELLVEHLRDYAVFTLDNAGNVTSWNRGAQQITDWRAEDVIGKNHAIFYARADAAAGKPQRDLTQARDEGWFEEDTRRVRQDGSEFWASVQLAAMTDGTAGTSPGSASPGSASRGGAATTSGFLSVVRDVTEQHRAHEALRQMNQALSGIINAAPLAILSLDRGGNVRDWNPAAEKIFGWTADEVLGNPLPTVPEDKRQEFEAMIRDQWSGKQMAGQEVRRRRKDGMMLDLSLWTAPLLDADAKIIGSMSIFVDLTDRRRAEEQVRQLNETLERRVAERTAQLEEANEELQAFSYTVSHDLRAPLRSLQHLAAELLRTQSERLDDAGKTDALRIVGAAARMQRLIEDVLEFSRVSRGELKLEPVSLVLIVHELLGRLERDPAYREAQISVEEPLGWVRANPLILQQVVLNLLINAITFVAPGQRPRVVVRSEDRGDRVRLCIEDNGVGIHAEDREKVFEVFQRLPDSSDHPGAGLGLAVARRGIQRMGGTIGIDASASGGSVFWIELPKIKGSM
jgi:PAS domain S-box-containing protein